MVLDPEVREFYKEKLEKKAFTPGTTDVHILRAEADKVFHDKEEIEPIFCWEERHLDLGGIEDTVKDALVAKYAQPLLDDLVKKDFPDMKVRIYYPDASMDLPILLYFHGGGFIMHNIKSHDALTRKLANTYQAIVVSAEYRLAPEHPYPAAVEDGYALFDWAVRHAEDISGDPDSILLGGDSAGAAIAAGVSRLACACGRGWQIAGQVLFYGSFTAAATERPSMTIYGDGSFVLPKKMAQDFTRHYIPENADPEDPFLYPAAGTIPEDYPYTLLVRGECDPLQDDSVYFAEKLEAAHLEYDSLLAKGMMHGFLLYWHKFCRVPDLLEQTAGLLPV